jgi:hypothetical protein
MPARKHLKLPGSTYLISGLFLLKLLHQTGNNFIGWFAAFFAGQTFQPFGLGIKLLIQLVK